MNRSSLSEMETEEDGHDAARGLRGVFPDGDLIPAD
jgi:hypothetical protein